MLNEKKWKGLITDELLSAAVLDSNLVGPILPPFPSFTLPTGPAPAMRLQFLYIANSATGNNTVEIYDIFNPLFPVRIGEFNGGNLNFPVDFAITGTILYISNLNDDTVEIYDITNPIIPVRVGEFNAGNLDGPAGLIITGTILYVTNINDNTVEIYDITNLLSPVHVGEFNSGNLDQPIGMAIFSLFG
ncbi:exosporium leader peptide-containing protein [Bacillus cereus]|uniref:exosporium leader peptide-containing protein n=1 Tax=Bacillus cereus TaxID=1396 RepID=UPI000B7CC8E8|nr:exosporium leader peptide-containing protein [Bacillus cereus]